MVDCKIPLTQGFGRNLIKYRLINNLKATAYSRAGVRMSSYPEHLSEWPMRFADAVHGQFTPDRVDQSVIAGAFFLEFSLHAVKFIRFG
jgi:hypothetical protein